MILKIHLLHFFSSLEMNTQELLDKEWARRRDIVIDDVTKNKLGGTKKLNPQAAYMYDWTNLTVTVAANQSNKEEKKEPAKERARFEVSPRGSSSRNSLSDFVATELRNGSRPEKDQRLLERDFQDPPERKVEPDLAQKPQPFQLPTFLTEPTQEKKQN